MDNISKLASWLTFFILFGIGTYLFYLYIFNVSNDFGEYFALSNRLRGEPLSYSFER